MYDFIGDIHGYYEDLRALLFQLGYEAKDGTMIHQDRKAFFLGDLVDRGPQIPKVLDLVRGMVEAGSAYAIMGNHELNLIGFHELSVSEPDTYLRPRNPRNWALCKESLKQIPNGKMNYYLDWMRTLPLYWEDQSFRAIHACWNSKAQALLQADLENGVIRKGHLQEIYSNKSKKEAIELLLKGPELGLPKEYEFKDELGQIRRRTRYNWWDTAKVLANPLKDLDISKLKISSDLPSYGEAERPVFFGHYCLKNQAYVTSSNAQCLDFRWPGRTSLTAYRFSGEKHIIERNLIPLL